MAFAQLTQEGKITGRVVDNQGVALPGVNVEATSTRLVGKATTITDANGAFRLMALPSGTFDIVFSLSGFNILNRKGIYLELSQTLTINVTLDQATVDEQVTVVGQAPLIDVKSTVKGQVMTKETYMTLPRGRSFDSLISTIPGVQNESITGGISVDGASGAENMFFVDGADVTDFHLGVKGQNVVLELLDEVKVTASGYNAEYGGSMGGVVNVISRAGSNEFHGDVMGFYENNAQWMQGSARDYLRQNPLDDYLYEYVNNDTLYFNGGKDRDKYNRFEGVFSLGGYIIKNKLWFFGSINTSYDKTAALRDFNLREGPFSTYQNKNNGYNGSVKLSAAPFAGFRLSASFLNNFTRYRGAIPNIVGNDDGEYEWGQEGMDYPNWTGALTADYSIGNTLLLTYRGGWHRQNETNQQLLPPDSSTYYFAYSNSIYSSDPFYVANPDLLHVGGYATTWNYFETQKYLTEKISNNLDATFYLNLMGEHSLKAGIGYAYLHEDVYDASTHPRIWLYPGRTYTGLGFPVGVGADPASPYYGAYGYYYVRGSFTSPYGGVWNIHANNYSAYVQDSWTINNRLTINLGLRAESQYIPSMTTDTSYPSYTGKPVKFNLGQMLAPRLGLVYDVFGDSSLKVFASYGIYYDVMKLYMAELTFGGWKRKQDYYALQDPDWTTIAESGMLDDAASQEAGNTYAGTVDFLPPSFDRVDPDLKPTAQREISFGAEKKLMDDLSLSVRLVNKHLIRTIEDVGVYVWDGTTLEQQFYVTNPGFGVSRPVSEGGLFSDDYWRCPKATREYYGLNISLEKRFSKNWQGGINYTLSRVSGSYTGLASSDEDGRLGPNVEQDYDRWFMGYDALGNVLNGPLPQDRPHYLKAYGSYIFPFGLTVGVVAYGRSGLPLTTKLYYNGKYFYPDGRADLGRLPFTFWADLYLDYTMKLGDKYRASINLQINNATNTRTIQSRIATYNLDGFSGYDAEILDGSFALNYRTFTADEDDVHPAFNQWATRFAPWSARLGLKFSF
ncbi:MAG: TonB-dependent receptor [Candidatus Aminicenantes bacterium]|nr:TonB-dependent receptor [Candidatus Aminicenantes bacterium]